MPKLVPELTDVSVRRLSHGKVKGGKRKNQKNPPGTPCVAYHAVGGVSGLFLQCRPPSSGEGVGPRSWILRATIGGKRRDIGLGSYPGVRLATARERARDMKEKIWQGVDPLVERKALRSALIAEQAKAVTFKEVAERYIQKKSAEFKTPEQGYKLRQRLERYAYPALGALVVADIDRAHVVALLEPIWSTKHETAARVRGYVEAVLNIARVEGLRTADNPARWGGNLELTFAASKKPEHHPALPLDDLPAFYAALKSLDTMSARALQFLILTAVRPGVVRGATWDEIDLDAKLWRIPPERMKKGRAHTVPLCDEAVRFLEKLPRLGEHIFPSPHGDKPLSNVMLSRLPKKLGHHVTAHGFRATFRTWAQEHTDYAEEVCELALAHVDSNATRAAYARGALLDKRRAMMADWEEALR